MNIWLLGLITLVIALLMTMTGRGGGNFYIIALVLSGISMHIAAATAQFILFTAAFFGMLVFGTKKSIEWKLAVFMGVLIAISAFLGGFCSHYVPGKTLKLILSFFIFIFALLMLKPVKNSTSETGKKDWKYWNIKSFNEATVYPVNLLIVVPTVVIFGFVAGMVGIAGGSFMVPLLVLACGMPMKNAVGTVSPLLFVSSLSGFIGHAVSGHFDYRLAIPLAIAGAVGGLIGGSIAMKSKPELLKILFALTNLAAAIIIAYKVFY